MPVNIVLIDPNRSRRLAYEQLLTGDVVLHSLADPEAANMLAIDLAIIALRQTNGHGLSIGKDLKTRHPDATVVVYGKLEGATSAGKVKERWGVDVHMPFVPEPTDIAALLATAKLAQQRRAAAAAERGRPPTRSNPGWGELLREPVTSESLKAVLKKDLFGR
jgi:DNA-binding NtrC family response regulator